jgi:hypothetical protein
VNNLSRRVEELESGGGPCPECGSDPRRKVTYQIIWPEDEQLLGEVSQPSVPCNLCGAQHSIVLNWEDIGEGGSW